MKQILIGIAITLLGGVNIYAQSNEDITPFTKYDYSTRPVGKDTIGGFYAGPHPDETKMKTFVENYNNGFFFICGGQMGNTTYQTNIQAGTSIVDLGGEVGKVLCINGSNSDFNTTQKSDLPQCGFADGWVKLNFLSDPTTTPTGGSAAAPNIHVKIVMNVYSNASNATKNLLEGTNIISGFDANTYATNGAVTPKEFYTDEKYDITKWMTYEFDTYCTGVKYRPLRLTLNFPYQKINDVTIFIKEISFTKIDPGNKSAFKKSFSTISATALTLDETYTSNTIKDLTGANFTFNRQMVSDKWNTFCVPFALTEDQIKATFDEGTQVREYEGANGNVLTFKEATDIKAGTPYLIKPTKADNKYIFKGVDITTTEAAKVGDGDIKFCGVYNQTNVDKLPTVGSHVSGIVDNMVKRAKTGSSIKGFRAYFSVPNNISESSEAALRVAIDGETTGIDAIEGFETKATTRVYNLSGQYVGTSTANLKPGVYVSGGKKVIVK